MGNQDAHQSFKHDCKSSATFAPCFIWNGNNLVTVKNGEPATLPCKVKNVDTTKTVISWWKENEMTEISLGQIILNPRYKLSKTAENDWSLIIKQTRISDAGPYICQINLSTLMELHVTLVVLKRKNADVRMDSITEEDISSSQLKPKYVFISGVSKAYTYSKVVLTCEVRYLYDNIYAGILWSHYDTFINVSGKWKDFVFIRWMGNLTLTSDLVLDPVLPEHSGRWACHKIQTSRSDQAESASIDLTVIDKMFKDIQNSSLKLTSKSSCHYRTECQVLMYSMVILLCLRCDFYLVFSICEDVGLL